MVPEVLGSNPTMAFIFSKIAPHSESNKSRSGGPKNLNFRRALPHDVCNDP